jgi:hypothetical protein
MHFMSDSFSHQSCKSGAAYKCCSKKKLSEKTAHRMAPPRYMRKEVYDPRLADTGSRLDLGPREISPVNIPEDCDDHNPKKQYDLEREESDLWET